MSEKQPVYKYLTEISGYKCLSVGFHAILEVGDCGLPFFCRYDACTQLHVSPVMECTGRYKSLQMKHLSTIWCPHRPHVIKRYNSYAVKTLKLKTVSVPYMIKIQYLIKLFTCCYNRHIIGKAYWQSICVAWFSSAEEVCSHTTPANLYPCAPVLVFGLEQHCRRKHSPVMLGSKVTAWSS